MYQQKLILNKQEKEAKMTITVGSQFTTQKSGVSGVVREIVKNASGSQRVRLELANGDTRWSTVK